MTPDTTVRIRRPRRHTTRTVKYTLYLTQAEHEQWTHRADQLRVTLSDYIRSRVDGQVQRDQDDAGRVAAAVTRDISIAIGAAVNAAMKTLADEQAEGIIDAVAAGLAAVIRATGRPMTVEEVHAFAGRMLAVYHDDGGETNEEGRRWQQST